MAFGDVVLSFLSVESFPTGLAWDGQYLWSLEFNHSIYKLDPSDGSVLHTIPSPTSQGNSLTWDGRYLWYTSRSDDRIRKLDPADGATLHDFASPGGEPRGLAWDGQYIWYGRNEGHIYKLHPVSGEVLLGPIALGIGEVDGLTWDGSHLWVSTETVSTIYQVDPTGAIVTTVANPGGDSHRDLAWDASGPYIWSANSSSDQIYKIEGIGLARQFLPAGRIDYRDRWMRSEYGYARDATWSEANDLRAVPLSGVGQ